MHCVIFPDTTGPTGLGLPMPMSNPNVVNTGNPQQSYGLAPQQAFGSPDGSFRQRAMNGDQAIIIGSGHGSSGGMRIGNTGLIQLVNPNTSTVACAPADAGASDRNGLPNPITSARLAIPQLSIPGGTPTTASGLIRLDVAKLSEEERAREFRNRNHDQLGNTPVNVSKVSGAHTPPAK